MSSTSSGLETILVFQPLQSIRSEDHIISSRSRLGIVSRISSETNSSSSLSGLGVTTDEDDATSTSTPVVVVRSGSRGSTTADELARYSNGLRPAQ